MTDSRCVLSHDKPTAAAVGQLCEHHLAMLREQLKDCAEMFALLPEFLLPGSTPPDDGSKHTKKGTIPAPVRLDVLALTDPRNASDLEWSYESNWDPARGRMTGNGADIPTFRLWLDGWAEYIRSERRMGDGDRTVAGNAHLVHVHMEWLAADSLLTVFVRELKNAHRALLTGVGRSPKRPLGKCWLLVDAFECAGPIWLDGDGASCGKCKETWSGSELIRLRLILEQQTAAVVNE